MKCTEGQINEMEKWYNNACWAGDPWGCFRTVGLFDLKKKKKKKKWSMQSIESIERTITKVRSLACKFKRDEL